MSERPEPALANVRLSGGLTLRRVHGSSVGRLPGYAYRVSFAPDYASLRVDLYDATYTASLLDGSVVRAPDAAPAARALEKRILERRGVRRRQGVTSVSLLLGHETESGAPAYCAATAHGPGRRSRKSIVDTATLRDVARLGYSWPVSFSPCGRFVAFARPRDERVTVVELATRASTRVRVPARDEHGPRRQLTLDGPSGSLVAAFRRTGDDPSQLACFDVETGALRWRALARGAPIHAGPAPDGSARVLWTQGAGWLEARAFGDGAVVHRLPADDAERFHIDPTGRFAAVTHYTEHSFARVDLRTGERVEHADGPGGIVLAIACAASGRSVARLFESGRVRTSSVATGAVEHDVDLGFEYGCLDPSALAFEAGESTVLCATETEFAARTQQCIRAALDTGMPGERSPALPGPAKELVPAPDGSSVWVVTAPIDGPSNKKHTALLLSPDLQRVLVQREGEGRYEGHPLAVSFCVDPADGRTAAVLVDAEECSVETFDAATGAHRGTRALLPPWMRAPLQGGSVRCSADGTRVFFEGDTTTDGYARRAVLCAPTFGAEPGPWRSLGERSEALAGVRQVGNEVALYEGYDGLRVHSLDDWRELGRCTIEARRDDVASTALSPDERTVYVGLRSGVVLECELDR